MDKSAVEKLLLAVKDGNLPVNQAMEKLACLPYGDIEFARPDFHRGLRQGFPEVIFCPGKTSGQVFEIAMKLRTQHACVIASRAESGLAGQVMKLALDARARLESAADSEGSPEQFIVEYLEQPRALIFGTLPAIDKEKPSVAIITAGTADIPVAEEAALLVVAAGYPVKCVYDVGVAGVKRLFDSLEVLRQSQVTIVIAGMDGALASFVGGLLARPVIAVPTSIGYGSSEGGKAALLSMLNSCAAGMTVVNIDNGFGAAMAALRILSLTN